MKGINSVFLLGHCGADPELRQLKSGTTVANFSLATHRAYRKGEEWQDETTWHKVEAWGHQAEKVARRLSKGDAVAIQGRIRVEHWTDREEKKRTTVRIVADRVEILGRRAAGLQAALAEGNSSHSSGSFGNSSEPDLDQIPF